MIHSPLPGMSRSIRSRGPAKSHPGPRKPGGGNLPKLIQLSARRAFADTFTTCGRIRQIDSACGWCPSLATRLFFRLGILYKWRPSEYDAHAWI